jgi:ABC-type dipeptide/oligopeptide/nickel transport system permease component
MCIRDSYQFNAQVEFQQSMTPFKQVFLPVFFLGSLAAAALARMVVSACDDSTDEVAVHPMIARRPFRRCRRRL